MTIILPTVAPKALSQDTNDDSGLNQELRLNGSGSWNFEVSPYLWLSGIDSKVSIGPVMSDSDAHLRRILTGYFDYYNRFRVHQSLEMDAPDERKNQAPKRVM